MRLHDAAAADDTLGLQVGLIGRAAGHDEAIAQIGLVEAGERSEAVFDDHGVAAVGGGGEDVAMRRDAFVPGHGRDTACEEKHAQVVRGSHGWLGVVLRRRTREAAPESQGPGGC